MKKILFACAAFGLMFSATAHSQNVTLRYAPKKGNAFTFKTTLNSLQNISAMGQDMQIDVNVNMDVLLNIKDASKKENSIEMSFKNASAKLNINGMEGTEALGGKDINAEIETMVSQMHLNYIIDELGKVVSVERSGFNNSSDPMVQGIGSGVVQLNRAFVDYPERALTKGETWSVTKNDTNTSRGGSIITTSTIMYTFDGMVDTLGVNCARILSKSTAMSMEGTAQQMGMNMNIDAEGSTTGITYVEIANGIPVTSTVSTQMDMRMAVSGQENMIIPMQTDMKITMNRVK